MPHPALPHKASANRPGISCLLQVRRLVRLFAFAKKLLSQMMYLYFIMFGGFLQKIAYYELIFCSAYKLLLRFMPAARPFWVHAPQGSFVTTREGSCRRWLTAVGAKRAERSRTRPLHEGSGHSSSMQRAYAG